MNTLELKLQVLEEAGAYNEDTVKTILGKMGKNQVVALAFELDPGGVEALMRAHLLKIVLANKRLKSTAPPAAKIAMPAVKTTGQPKQWAVQASKQSKNKKGRNEQKKSGRRPQESSFSPATYVSIWKVAGVSEALKNRGYNDNGLDPDHKGQPKAGSLLQGMEERGDGYQRPKLGKRNAALTYPFEFRITEDGYEFVERVDNEWVELTFAEASKKHIEYFDRSQKIMNAARQ